MEILIVVAIWTVIVKRGVEDIWHQARGNTPHRYAAAKARRSSGAAGRYWGALKDDTFDGMLRRHNNRVGRRAERRSARPRPRGAMGRFFGTATLHARRSFWQRWDEGWTRREEKVRAKTTRPRPGQQTVPGEVVPNQDETQDGPQDGAQDGPENEMQDRPQDEAGPDPRTVPTPDGGTDLQDEDQPTDPGTDGEPSVPDQTPDSGPDNQTTTPLASTTTQEGTTTMTTTMPTGEVTGLEPAITFFEASADAFREQVIRTEQTLAALDGFDVSGPARAEAAASMEQSSAAAISSQKVADELKKHRVVAEAIDAVQGAGQREFYTAGR